MKIRKVIDQRVHNVLMSGDSKTPFIYKVDGIYLVTKWSSTNISNYYIQDPERCLDFLEEIIENEETNYKTKIAARQIINDFIKMNAI